jgi:arylsulfatase A-like enzyme/Tfp pilus assembly protein PilF
VVEALMRFSIGCALALAGSTIASAGLPEARQQSRPNVLLVTLDTVRADRIGAYGFKLANTPALDRLAAEGVRFADATSQSPLTGPAHAALLTGQYPGRLAIKNNATTPIPDATITLAESLRTAGYRTGAFIGAFVVDRAYGFAQGFDHFDADFRGFRQEIKAQVQRRASDVVDPALAWLKTIPGGTPFFVWVHLYDAHAPYYAPAPFGAQFKARPYDGEIAYVDAQLDRLISRLRTSGILDNTIVIAVGDHGEALGDHGEEDHGIFVYDEVMRIPWIMRLPSTVASSKRGTIIREQVRSIDLTPTVLDLVSLRTAGRVDGESLLPLLSGGTRADTPPSFGESWYPELHFGWSRLRSLRVGEWKYIDAPKPELYDLRTDPGERRNVIADRSNVAARMSQELDATERGFGAAVSAKPAQPDPETVARLRSLGYVGLAAPGGGGARGPDPKDKILELREFRSLLTRAGDDLRAKRTDAAIQKLKRAVALNERSYDVHVLLGSAYEQKGQTEQALGEYDAAALLSPVTAAPHVLASGILVGQGELQRAMERLDKADALEPNSGEIAAMRGRVFQRGGRGPEALAAFERAVALNPADVNARGLLVGVAMALRRYEIAEPQLKFLLERKHQPSRTHFALGQIAEARGDRATAAAEYKRALALEPGLKPAREALASLSK